MLAAKKPGVWAEMGQADEELRFLVPSPENPLPALALLGSHVLAAHLWVSVSSDMRIFPGHLPGGGGDKILSDCTGVP